MNFSNMIGTGITNVGTALKPIGSALKPVADFVKDYKEPIGLAAQFGGAYLDYKQNQDILDMQKRQMALAEQDRARAIAQQDAAKGAVGAAYDSAFGTVWGDGKPSQPGLASLYATPEDPSRTLTNMSTYYGV